MKFRAIIAAAAAPLALGGVLLTTTAASATTGANPGNGAVVITSQAQADALSGTTINQNVVVAAGAATTHPDGTIWLTYATINGNVNVQGELTMASDTVVGSVTVSGPGSFLGLTNQASHLERNLTVQGSSGIYTGGPGTTSFGNWTQYPGAGLPTAQSQVDGNFTFTGNSGNLYVGYPMQVNGNFTYAGNTSAGGPYLSGLTVLGSSSIS
jgi:hypothetical protein